MATSTVPAQSTVKVRYGHSVLVAGVIAPQVNPLTGKRIPKDAPVIVAYDRWIEIQLNAGVLKQFDL